MSQSKAAQRSTLILVPTELEVRHFERQRGFDSVASEVEQCGFGPIASAARTAQLIAKVMPSRVILAGIAGSYDVEHCEIGQAYAFRTVSIYGVGAGTGAQHTPIKEMGFVQWPPIVDTVGLAVPKHVDNQESLLTCCAASGSAVDVKDRRRCFPNAVAEDMEGFGVALACEISGAELTIIRGISNVAGERDTVNWKVGEAIAAAWQLLQQLDLPGVMESQA